MLYGTDGNAIVSGVPWYDQRDSIVSAHGANVIEDNGKYYMFGEFKTDSVNDFKGFSCYSSPDLVNWTFERIVLAEHKDGRLGPGRVGERPKVLKCPSTGEYIMIMHSDDRGYKDPCTAYATSPTINGEYTFRGPLLYKGEPIKKWDVGTFTDIDGKSYLLVHHGDIYRFADDYHNLDSCMCKKVDGVGESPAMLHRNGKYYWFSSHTTSWERNDNMYVSSESLSGPWEKHELFTPKGTNTWNSQTSFILPVVTDSDTTFVYMGDRWSFPKQRSAATYVWQPIEWEDGEPFIPSYAETWSPETMMPCDIATAPIKNTSWTGEKPGDNVKFKINLKKPGKLYIKGNTGDICPYADITIRDSEGQSVVETPIDFYSLAPATGLRYISPTLKEGNYTMEIKVSDMKPNWSDKRHTVYGSKGYHVEVIEIGTIDL
ncbi:MAG: family 43 glycosylhydrolase [Muribaculaceae bacterium]|nr:family 43 glycosylhydrolase [Muribaculaceae bacterium]